MDFSLSPRTEELSASMWDFMREHVFPAESVYPSGAQRILIMRGPRSSMKRVAREYSICSAVTGCTRLPARSCWVLASDSPS
jgi:hypothetical protein